MAVVQVFEHIFLGLTTSQWTIVILILLIMALAFALIVFVHLAGPTFGYIKAIIDKKQNVGILIQNHDITIKSIDYFAGVFEALGLTWLQRRRENHKFGGCTAEIIADFWGFTMDPKIQIATKQFISDWNREVMIAQEAGDNSKGLITDYHSFYAALETLSPDHDIRIRAFSFVPVYELRHYYPKNLSAADLTGANEAMKKVVQDKQNSKTVTWLPLICFVAGVGLGVAIMFLSKGG
jgi:hypothetical protein